MISKLPLSKHCKISVDKERDIYCDDVVKPPYRKCEEIGFCPKRWYNAGCPKDWLKDADTQ